MWLQLMQRIAPILGIAAQLGQGSVAFRQHVRLHHPAGQLGNEAFLNARRAMSRCVSFTFMRCESFSYQALAIATAAAASVALLAHRGEHLVEVALAHIHVELAAVAVSHFGHADVACDGRRVVITDIAQHAAEAAILLHIFANVFGGQYQGDGRHRLHLHHVLRIAAQVFVAPARVANHMDGVGFARWAGGNSSGKKTPPLIFSGKGFRLRIVTG